MSGRWACVNELSHYEWYPNRNNPLKYKAYIYDMSTCSANHPAERSLWSLYIFADKRVRERRKADPAFHPSPKTYSSYI